MLIYGVFGVYYVLCVLWGVYAVKEWWKADWKKVEWEMLRGTLKHEECEPFHRMDDDRTKYNRLLCALGIFVLLPLRFLVTLLIAIATCSLILIAGSLFDPLTFRLHTFTICAALLKRRLGSRSYRLRFCIATLIRFGLFVMGIVSIREHAVLGRAQPPTTLLNVVVSNHVSALDILIFLYRDLAAFVAKVSVLNIPLIGRCARVLGTLFVDRSSEDSREQALRAIFQRQIAMSDPNIPCAPLVLFAEGTTTSGRTVLPLKRGAFSSLKPVTPVVLKYSNAFFNPSYDVLHYSVWLPLLFIAPCPTTVDVSWLPDATPPLGELTTEQERVEKFMLETQYKMCEALKSKPPCLEPGWPSALDIKISLRQIFQAPRLDSTKLTGKRR